MKVVPQAFYQHPIIEKVLVDGLSCVILKNVQKADLQNQRYLASHALTLVLNGSLRIENDKGELTLVHKNEIILLPKGLYMISDIIPKNDSFQAIVFFFDEPVVDEFLAHMNTYPVMNGHKTFVVKYEENLRLYVDTLMTLYRGKNQHQFTRTKLLELLHLIGISEKGDQFIGVLQHLKKREKKNIRAFMKDHFNKPLDVEDYAYLTGRSISTFRRDFKSRYGISPKKWLIEKRLARATELLKQESDSVTAVAHKVGYENVSHFIKAFQKRYHISPKQYQLKTRKHMSV